MTRDLWHTDFVGTARPTMGTVLYAKDIPPRGGDTVWVNMVAAYEALSDRMKAHLEGLEAYHDSYQPYAQEVRPEMYDADKGTDYIRDRRAKYLPSLHPLIRKHPVTGKRGLFVNESMTSFIKDMDRKRYAAAVFVRLSSHPGIQLPAQMEDQRSGSLGQPGVAALRVVRLHRSSPDAPGRHPG